MNKTRERLLDVAERLFAEKGFYGVGVREITAYAKTHLSAVNYHFGSKEGLYLAVFRERFVGRAKRVLEEFRRRKRGAETPEDVVKAFAQAVLMGPLGEEERVVHYRLLAREITEPTKAFEVISKEAVGPIVEELFKDLRGFFQIDQEDLRLCILSVFSQVIYFNFARPKVSALVGKRYTRSFLKRLVDHIVSFSMEGIRGFEGSS